MEELRAYLRTLDVRAQHAFANRCGTSLGYLRKALSVKGRLGEHIVIAAERESGGKVRCENLRPDIDWAYLRGTTQRRVSNRSVKVRA